MSSRDTYHHGDLKATILGRSRSPGSRTWRRRPLAARAGPCRGCLPCGACPSLHRPPRPVHRAGDRGIPHAGRRADRRAAGLPRRGAGVCPVRDRPSRPLRRDVRQVAVRRDRPRARPRRNGCRRRVGGRRRDPRRSARERRPPGGRSSRHGLWCTAFRYCGSTGQSTTTPIRWPPCAGWPECCTGPSR